MKIPIGASARISFRHYTRQALLPLTESLKDTVARMRPLWDEVITPAIPAECQVIVTQYGNSLDALIKILEHISAEGMGGLDVPNAILLGYRLNDYLQVIDRYPIEVLH